MVGVHQLAALVEGEIVGEDAADGAGAAAGRAARLVQRRRDALVAQGVERGQAGEAAADDGDAPALLGESRPAREGSEADAAGERGEDPAAGDVGDGGLGRRRSGLGQVHCARPIERPPNSLSSSHGLSPFSLVGASLTAKADGSEAFHALPFALRLC